MYKNFWLMLIISCFGLLSAEPKPERPLFSAVPYKKELVVRPKLVVVKNNKFSWQEKFKIGIVVIVPAAIVVFTALAFWWKNRPHQHAYVFAGDYFPRASAIPVASHIIPHIDRAIEPPFPVVSTPPIIGKASVIPVQSEGCSSATSGEARTPGFRHLSRGPLPIAVCRLPATVITATPIALPFARLGLSIVRDPVYTEIVELIQHGGSSVTHAGRQRLAELTPVSADATGAAANPRVQVLGGLIESEMARPVARPTAGLLPVAKSEVIKAFEAAFIAQANCNFFQALMTAELAAAPQEREQLTTALTSAQRSVALARQYLRAAQDLEGALESSQGAEVINALDIEAQLAAKRANEADDSIWQNYQALFGARTAKQNISKASIIGGFALHRPVEPRVVSALDAGLPAMGETLTDISGTADSALAQLNHIVAMEAQWQEWLRVADHMSLLATARSTQAANAAQEAVRRTGAESFPGRAMVIYRDAAALAKRVAEIEQHSVAGLIEAIDRLRHYKFASDLCTTPISFAVTRTCYELLVATRYCSFLASKVAEVREETASYVICTAGGANQNAVARKIFGNTALSQYVEQVGRVQKYARIADFVKRQIDLAVINFEQAVNRPSHE